MGKYMRKAKITGEVSVMEVSQSTLGVRTRARTLALERLQKTTSSDSYLQLRNRRLEKPPLLVTTDSKKTKETCKENRRILSGSVHSGPVGSVSLSCSKKKEDEEENEVSFGENVLEIDGRERNIRETTPSSLIRGSDSVGTPGSTTRPTNSTAANRRIQNVAHRNVPTSHEMEEFFAGVEQQQQRIFTEKYNFDPVNDLPLPGRYEWVWLDP
ncbi:inhibitor/interactor with cyclin-dependent kinase [Tasmannia lanceolata]|uniref:inhibitor/interactor with cyclin-dependent kinase n=1 Tax=Tasmannia lanceolata TaxID=3420 RepID=UPI004063AEF0